MVSPSSIFQVFKYVKLFWRLFGSTGFHGVFFRGFSIKQLDLLKTSCISFVTFYYFCTKLFKILFFFQVFTWSCHEGCVEAPIRLAFSDPSRCYPTQHSRLSQNYQTPYGFRYHQEKAGTQLLLFRQNLYQRLQHRFHQLLCV